MLVIVLIVGIGLLAGALVPADVLPARAAVVVESHRLDIAFGGLALAAGVAVAVVFASLGG